jgi:hypothetical protein
MPILALEFARGDCAHSGATATAETLVGPQVRINALDWMLRMLVSRRSRLRYILYPVAHELIDLLIGRMRQFTIPPHLRQSPWQGK